MIKKLQDKFLYGYCNVFAVILNELYKKPIVAFVENEDVIHIAVEYKPMVYLDASGTTNLTNIKNRYDIKDARILELSAIDAASYLRYNQQDITDASIVYAQLKSLKLLP